MGSSSRRPHRNRHARPRSVGVCVPANSRYEGNHGNEAPERTAQRHARHPGRRAGATGNRHASAPARNSILGPGDLLHITKALLVRVVTQSLRHRWSDGQLPADLAPQNAPHRAHAHQFWIRIMCLTWVELSGLEPLLLHAMNHRHVRRPRHTLRQAPRHSACVRWRVPVAVMPQAGRLIEHGHRRQR
jgi:hypothetical protein